MTKNVTSCARPRPLGVSTTDIHQTKSALRATLSRRLSLTISSFYPPCPKEALESRYWALQTTHRIHQLKRHRSWLKPPRARRGPKTLESQVKPSQPQTTLCQLSSNLGLYSWYLRLDSGRKCILIYLCKKYKPNAPIRTNSIRK